MTPALLTQPGVWPRPREVIDMQTLRARTLAQARRPAAPDDGSGVDRGERIDELLRHATARIAAVGSHVEPDDAARVAEPICALEDVTG